MLLVTLNSYFIFFTLLLKYGKPLVTTRRSISLSKLFIQKIYCTKISALHRWQCFEVGLDKQFIPRFSEITFCAVTHIER